MQAVIDGARRLGIRPGGGAGRHLAHRIVDPRTYRVLIPIAHRRPRPRARITPRPFRKQPNAPVRPSPSLKAKGYGELAVVSHSVTAHEQVQGTPDPVVKSWASLGPSSRASPRA